MKNLFTRFIKEEEGQDLIEYALLAAFIAVAVVAAVTSVGGTVKNIFTSVNNSLS
jgi:pilus assembly protein Flp/PilA